MDFDKPKVYGDTSITDGLVIFTYAYALISYIVVKGPYFGCLGSLLGPYFTRKGVLIGSLS